MLGPEPRVVAEFDLDNGFFPSSVGGVRLLSHSCIIVDIVLLRFPGVSLSRAGHWISSRLEGVLDPSED